MAMNRMIHAARRPRLGQSPVRCRRGSRWKATWQGNKVLMSAVKDPERRRLQAMRDQSEDWRRWGPYVSERQWGPVREDYSEGGTAWDYFPHDHARSRAYRWGEDGLAGFCDNRQLLCLSLALWNGS